MGRARERSRHVPLLVGLAPKRLMVPICSIPFSGPCYNSVAASKAYPSKGKVAKCCWPKTTNLPRRRNPSAYLLSYQRSDTSHSALDLKVKIRDV
jgi:hypothetical protein